MLTGDKGKLFSNFFVLSIIQGANMLLSLVVIPYVILLVGAEGFGAIAVAQIVMTVLSTVSDYGFTLTATRDIALHREDKHAVSRIFWVVLTSKLMLMSVLFVLLLLTGLFTPLFTGHFQLYVLGFAFVTGQSLLVNWFFQGIEKMQYITVSTLIGRSVFVILVFIFIHHPQDGVYYLFFFGIGNIVAGILTIFFAMKVCGITLIVPRKRDILDEFRNGWQLTVSSLTMNSYFYTNVLILRFFSNDLVVGYFSIAERILFAIRQVITLFVQVVYPYICNLTRKSKFASNLFFSNIYSPFLLLIFCGCCILFIFSSQVIGLLMGNAPLLPVQLLRLLSFVPFIICLNIPACQLLLAMRHTKSYVRIITFGTIINLSANILLTYRWGAMGTACSIIITELFITIGLNFELYRNNLTGFINQQLSPRNSTA